MWNQTAWAHSLLGHIETFSAPATVLNQLYLFHWYRGSTWNSAPNMPSVQCISLNMLRSIVRVCVCVCSCACYVTSVVSDSLQPYGLQPTRFLYPWDSPAKNTGVGCHNFLQGILPTQGSNLRLLQLLHCRRILYCLQIYMESPHMYLYIVNIQ